MGKASNRVTLKQIADRTGFSVITVSKALRDCDDIALRTRAAIRAAANEMGYVMNGAANALRSGRSMCIALSVVDITNSFWSLFAKHAEEIAREHGYSMIILNIDMCAQTERNAIRTALRQGVDGMLIDPSHGYLENVKMLEQARVPFVILEHPPVAASMNSATCDHMGGAYLAATYMASRGCRKILFLNLEHFPWRRDSFEQGLVDSGLSVAENMVFHRLTSVQGETYDILTEELARHPDIDSIFAFNDAVAYDAICSLKKLGKGVPKDIRVVGNGDTESFLSIPVSLTSLHSSPIRLADEAMKLLLDNLSSEEPVPPKHVVLPVTLTVRDSC
ncbi:MAG TPA: LacI family DNA-binding transcriptional regulator [Candidatus Pullichristensenella stercorigallinarum]|uniref:LacI family DNA-binding transcriptional regulator n=1 Tax=Candidatus Pullichristensenella stercorigallinarum TaxID=2840909 RepID=A0A9D0ZPK1_9FIRM|nr:LacI family DNA-binding transcriptional regulator [Candidatus Pullichristensenella stercorigallinarum]